MTMTIMLCRSHVMCNKKFIICKYHSAHGTSNLGWLPQGFSIIELK